MLGFTLRPYPQVTSVLHNQAYEKYVHNTVVCLNKSVVIKQIDLHSKYLYIIVHYWLIYLL